MKFLVDRPVGVLLSYLSLVLLGIAAYLYLPVSLMPNLDIPTITVRIKQAEASANDIEQHITSPLRERLRQLSGLEDINSVTQEGSAQLQLQFTHGTNIHLSFIEVNEQIDLSMNDLPRDAARPQVIKASSTDIPAFFCNIRLAAESDPAAFGRLCDLAEKVIKKRIEQLPEVAMTDITGLNKQRILIVPDENKLHTLNIQPGNIQQLLQENNLQLGNIMVKDGQYQYYLHFSSNLYSPDDAANIPVNIKGRLIQLKDLGDIRIQDIPPTGGFYAGSQQAVNLAVIKQPGARMADLQHDFRILINVMRKDYPDLRFEIAQDQSTLLDYAISNLQQDLLLGGTLAIVLVLLFIRKVRLALLIGLVIPVSLVLCQLLFYCFHVSLNIISLNGLILGLGMIIDNSIVVIDNITQYIDEGMPLRNACVIGTSEVAKPLFTSLLTNCSIFLPLIFLSGMAGALFYEQAISMTTGIFVSMIVSLTLLPVLYRLVKRTPVIPSGRSAVDRDGYLDRLYEKGLHLAMKLPRTMLIGNLLMVIAAVIAFNKMSWERFPDLDAHNVELRVNWNEPLSYEENNARIKAMMDQLSKNISLYNCWIGQQQYMINRNYDMDATQALVYIETTEARQLKEIKREVSNYFHEHYISADFRFTPAATPLEQLFGQQQAPLVLQLYHNGNRQMPDIASSTTMVGEINRLAPTVKIPPPALRKNLKVHINYELLALYNIQPAAIMNTLSSKLKAKQIDEIQGSAAMIPVVIGTDSAITPDELLSDLFVYNGSGKSFPVKSFVSITDEYDYKYITGGAQGLYYPIDVSTPDPGKELRLLRPLIKKYPPPTLEVKGSYFYNQQLVRELGFILLISVLLLYFILAAQFESLLQPVIILVELPLDMAGAVLLLYVTGSSINLMSMIGLIVMCGIIINDSILKIDAINQLVNSGVALDSAIHTAGKKRLHSIVMITLTTTGTLLPTLFMRDPGSLLQQPLVIALIGGMIPGMFVSLLVIPMLYRFFYLRKNRHRITLKKINIPDEVASL